MTDDPIPVPLLTLQPDNTYEYTPQILEDHNSLPGEMNACNAGGLPTKRAANNWLIIHTGSEDGRREGCEGRVRWSEKNNKVHFGTESWRMVCPRCSRGVKDNEVLFLNQRQMPFYVRVNSIYALPEEKLQTLSPVLERNDLVQLAHEIQQRKEYSSEQWDRPPFERFEDAEFFYNDIDLEEKREEWIERITSDADEWNIEVIYPDD